MAIKKKDNPNHPKEGDRIKVEPIRELEGLSKSIKRLLADNPRNLAIFVLGINTNLRASDLLKITAGMVRNCKVGDEIVLDRKEDRQGTANYVEQKRCGSSTGAFIFQDISGQGPSVYRATWTLNRSNCKRNGQVLV
jgi:hypothetical protein